LLAASLHTERWYHWVGIAFLALAAAPWRFPPANLLSLAAVSYCAWQIINALFISPVYAAEGIYQPLMLLCSFVAFATTARERAAELFGAGVALMSGLALLGLLQYFLGVWQLDWTVWHLEENSLRAAGTFVTPNTFATAINMFLVPMGALYLVKGTGRHLAIVLWLFAGLVATQSRGGMLAWMAGLGYVAVCVGMPMLRRHSERILRMLLGCIAMWIAVTALATFAFQGGDSVRSIAPWIARGMAERPELYAATFNLILQHPVAGAGANMFYPLFETVKPAWLRDSVYFYAHNDYLQAWLEFGALGIALLLALAASALIIALRAQRRVPGDSVPLVCGAGLAACLAQAMVDFPLYIPFLLVLVGAYLGALAAHQGNRRPARAAAAGQSSSGNFSPPLRWAVALATLLWLSQPMLAEMVVYRSIAVLQRGDVSDGLYWLSVARRLEPRHPAHYWAEGTVWREQAVMTGNPLLAEQADALFAEGVRVNPYEVGNLVARIELHRGHPDLLKHAAPPAQILAWAEQAAALRPRSLPVQGELARALAYAGERERARTLARTLLEQYPASNLTRRLAAEL